MHGLNRAHLAFTSIDLTLREFERYREQMERYFIQERYRIDEEYKTFDPREVDDTGHALDYLGYLEECYGELETSFPNNFRSSFLIQIVSFIEYELRKICNLHSEFTKSAFTLKDLRGNKEFDRMTVYLEKVANIDLKTVNPEWETLQRIYKVRNKFAHHTGIVQTKDTNMKETLTPLYYISAKVEVKEKIKEKGKEKEKDKVIEYSLMLEMEFNALLIKTTTEFFRKLLNDNLHIPMSLSEILGS